MLYLGFVDDIVSVIISFEVWEKLWISFLLIYSWEDSCLVYGIVCKDFICIL